MSPVTTAGKVLRSATLLTLLALTFNVLGQVQDPDDEAIDQIEVVGRMTNVEVTSEDMERYQVSDLEDIFRHIPSVSVGGSLGIAQKIYIRGMEDTLINVSIDGAPQTGTLFHHIGRVKIEPELLRQVSVQTGAGEATAGFGAIGGAIRFQTKNATELLADDRNFGSLLKVGAYSNDGHRLSASAFGRLSENWGLLGSYVFVDRDDMKDGNGTTLQGTAAEQKLAFVKLSGDIGGNQRLSLSYEYRDEEGHFGQRPNWPAFDGDTLYPGTGERNTAVFNYSVAESEVLNVEMTAYLTQSEFVQDRFDTWGRYGAEIDTWGFDLRNTTSLGDHSFTYGIEHRDDEVVSAYLDDASVWQDWAWDPNIGEFSEHGTAMGIYVQDHYQATTAMLLSYGLRYDAYDFEQVTYNESTDDDAVSANVGMEYSLTDELTFLISYAEAMRGKEIGDAFTLEKRPGRIRLDPALVAEDVGNFEVGFDFQAGPFFASLVYFNTEIEDVVFDQIGGGPPPQDASYFENVGKYSADGYELELGFQGNRSRIELAYSDMSTDLNGIPVEGYEHNGLANVRGDTLNLSVDYDLSDRLQLGWSMMSVAGVDDIEVLYRSVEIGWIGEIQTIDKPGYAVHDVYMSWQPTQRDSIKMYLAVQNLFDKAYRDHSSVGDYTGIPDWEIVAGLYEPGRDLRLTLTAGF
jgi:hemoglobin/transferrin/lactoferrin receptor protein